MQAGSVKRHGSGWRGRWREDGRLRSTRIVATKGEARELLQAELDRIRLGERWREPVTLAQLVERFLMQHQAQPRTVAKVTKQLTRPVAVFGHVQACDVTGEAIAGWVRGLPLRDVTRSDMVIALRSTYKWGIAAGLVDANPAAAVRIARPKRSDRVRVFDAWSEVEAVAAEAGRYGPMILLAVDTGARPGELLALEHRHVDGDKVYLPGTKSANARRVVHLTSRGVAALAAVPRNLHTPLVFTSPDGRPVHLEMFRREVWLPALELAGLERRPFYSCRHTFAVFSLRAGVPVNDLARELGHANVAVTYQTYGGWVSEMGQRAASRREAWAASAEETTTRVPIG
jgi:integrase